MSPNNGPLNKQPSFLDRGTLIAFAIIIAFWFGWSKYMESQAPKSVPQQQTAEAPKAGEQVPGKTTDGSLTGDAIAAAPAAPSEETFVDFNDAHWSFQISSKGMGLKNIDVKDFRTRHDEPVILGKVAGNYPFSTYLTGSAAPIDFAIEKTGSDTFVGRGTVNGMQIEKTMKVSSSTYSIETNVKVVGAGAGGFTGVTTVLSEAIAQKASGGFLSSSATADHQDWFLLHEGTKTRQLVNGEKGDELAAKNVNIAVLGEHYFAMALVDRSEITPRFETKTLPGAKEVVGYVIHQPVNPVDEFTVKYVSFAGPKSFDVLKQVDENLSQAIDLGTFAFLGKPMLWLLKFLHSIMHNWGWAIIALTIIVRLIVLPFNIYSFKSMKVMQRVQPEMNRIREKYKDKPADQKIQMNQEIMELMKRNKANPLGGCLPMLLQIPVFIALWQVLGQSIELYRAPFALWIHDLSMMDPYFVLPVLMGITMFVQQKITPTTMDPAQAKILMWMPVIFSVFMISLPSGLTLYMFVSGLFGITQQYVFMRDKTSAKTVKEAKA